MTNNITKDLSEKRGKLSQKPAPVERQRHSCASEAARTALRPFQRPLSNGAAEQRSGGANQKEPMQDAFRTPAWSGREQATANYSPKRTQKLSLVH